jgi:hypothetical protein
MKRKKTLKRCLQILSFKYSGADSKLVHVTRYTLKHVSDVYGRIVRTNRWNLKKKLLHN